MADVVLKNVQKSFGRMKVIRGVDLDIRDGEFVVFVGPSGCGKSTLLRLIAGLEDITAGDLFIGGERVNDLVPAKRGIAMVFQSYALYPHMNVYDNMAFGLELAKSSKPEIDAKVREAARMLQIEQLLDRKPRQLSGGQRQRVAIGRAIVRIEIAKLHTDTRATMIYVTHDQVEAMTLADRIVVLNAGGIEQVGTPLELYHRPANIFVAGFIGSPQMNLIECRVAGIGTDEVLVGLPSGGTLAVPASPDGIRPGDDLTLGVRPDHVRIGAQGLCGCRRWPPPDRPRAGRRAARGRLDRQPRPRPRVLPPVPQLGCGFALTEQRNGTGTYCVQCREDHGLGSHCHSRPGRSGGKGNPQRRVWSWIPFPAFGRRG
jgi:multiple sugar transport system ATP-binding protein